MCEPEVYEYAVFGDVLGTYGTDECEYPDEWDPWVGDWVGW
jgi:hypothetical protein